MAPTTHGVEAKSAAMRSAISVNHTSDGAAVTSTACTRALSSHATPAAQFRLSGAAGMPSVPPHHAPRAPQKKHYLCVYVKASMDNETIASTQVMQNARDVLHLATHQVFQPLYAIRQDHLRALEGGGGRRGRAADVHAYVDERALRARHNKAQQTNVRKIKAIIGRIKALYARLQRELGKRFHTDDARQQAMHLVQKLSTQLFGVVEFFRRQLDKIRQMPSAVAASMRGLPASWEDFRHRYVDGRGRRRNPIRAARRRSPYSRG